MRLGCVGSLLRSAVKAQPNRDLFEAQLEEAARPTPSPSAKSHSTPPAHLENVRAAAAAAAQAINLEKPMATDLPFTRPDSPLEEMAAPTSA